MSIGSSQPPVSVVAAPPPLRLAHWPIRDEPCLRWAWAGLMLATLSATWIVTRGPWATALAGGAVLLSLWRLFVPARYEINGHGVRETCLGRQRRVSWRAIGDWELGRHGIYLYPRPESAAAAGSRSLYVPLGPHPEAVLRLLEHYMTEPQRGSSAGPLSAEAGDTTLPAPPPADRSTPAEGEAP